MHDLAAEEAVTWREIMSAAEAGRAAATQAPCVFRALAGEIAAHLDAFCVKQAPGAHELGFWAFWLASAITGRPGLLDRPSRQLPASYATIRAALGEHVAEPRLAVAVLHMTAFPVVAMLLEEAHRHLGGARPFVLVQRRNLASLDAALGAPVATRAEVVLAGAPGFRALGGVLRRETAMRLLIFPDGPVGRGAPGARARWTVGGRVILGAGALRLCFRHRVPVLPILHHFEAGRLVVMPRPLVRPDGGGADALDDLVRAVLGPLEPMLRERPEQWLGWASVAVRR